MWVRQRFTKSLLLTKLDDTGVFVYIRRNLQALCSDAEHQQHMQADPCFPPTAMHNSMCVVLRQCVACHAVSQAWQCSDSELHT